MKATSFIVTQTMIDAVFSDPQLRNKFPNPQEAQAICEMRLTGATYDEIGKKYEVSGGHCGRVVRKLNWIYKLFCEENQDEDKSEP
jgi:hypothetical protein